MTAIFNGLGTGLERNQSWYLGARAQMGNPVQGRAADNVFFNAATGNLIVQNNDEVLIGQGPDAIFARTYNSLGAFTGSLATDSDNWLFNQQRMLFRSNTNGKQLNESGSKLTLIDWDGTQIIWDYVPSANGGSGGYTSTQLPYNDDVIVYTAGATPNGAGYGTGTLTWVDGKTGLRQVFRVQSSNASNTGLRTRLQSVADIDGNTINYGYENDTLTGRLQSITTFTHSTGQTNVTSVAYQSASSNNVVSITTNYFDRVTGQNGRTLTRTYYSYDASNRLIEARIDKTPENNSIADGDFYSTTYTYKGTSGAAAKQIASIVQTDGSSLLIDYNATGRVSRLTQSSLPGAARVTEFSYGTHPAGSIWGGTDYSGRSFTRITDALGNVTTMTYDAQGRLQRAEEPPAAPGGGARITTVVYDTLANFTGAALSSDIKVFEGLAAEAAGIFTSREYRILDANGNILEEGQSAGAANTNLVNITRYTYDLAYLNLTSRHRLLSASQYVGTDSDGPGLTPPGSALVTRYVYDDAGSATSLVADDGSRYANTAVNLQADRAENHLRFTVSAEGRVTEYRYNAAGQVIAQLDYTNRVYSGTVFTEAALADWVDAAATDKTTVQRTDTVYDFRGNIQETKSYARTLANGAGDPSAVVSQTTYIYDQYGKLRSRRMSGGSVGEPTLYGSELFVYDGLGRIISSTDFNGTQTTITINDQNRTTTIAAPGATTRVDQFNSAGELIGSSQSGADPAAATTSYQYDRLGRLRVVTDATGVSSYMLYDAQSRKVVDIDADGSVVEYRYDAGNRLIGSIAYANRLNTAQLALIGDAATNIDWAIFRPSNFSSVDDRRSWNVYDRAGRLLQSIDAMGAVVGFEYDNASRLTRRTAFASLVDVSTFATTPPSSPVSVVIDPLKDRVLRNFYDRDGLLVAMLDEEGYLTETFYDGAGRKVRTLASANVIAAANRNGALLADVKAAHIGNPADISNFWLYDGRGQVRAAIDGEGNVSNFEYTALGQLRQQIAGRRIDIDAFIAAGAAQQTLASLPTRYLSGQTEDVTDYTYGTNGQVATRTRTLSSGTEVTSYSYDALGRLLSETVTDSYTGTAEIRTATNRYDAKGRVVATLSGRGSAALAEPGANTEAVWNSYGTRFVYDAADRLIARIDPDGSGTAGNRTLFYYDSDGNLRFEINALGEVTEYRYTVFEQLSETIVHAERLTTTQLAALTGGLLNAATEALVARDTAADTIVSNIYNRRGELISRTAADGQVSAFAYAAFAGELVEQVNNPGTGVADRHVFTYDRRGLQLSHLRYLNGGLSGASYSGSSNDAFGRLKELQTNNSDGRKFVYEYDRAGRLIQSTDRSGATESFGYDSRSNRISHTDRTGATTYYQHDKFSRSIITTTVENIVTEVKRNAQGQTISIRDGENRTTSYTYDKSGNLKTVTDFAGVTTSDYDLANRLSFVTDANGVQTRFTYDAANRQLTRTEDFGAGRLNITTAYAYDAKGQRIEVTSAVGTAEQVVTLIAYEASGRQSHIIQDAGSGRLNIRTNYLYRTDGKVEFQIDAVGTPAERKTYFEYDSMGRLTRTTEDQGAGRLNIVTNYVWDENGNMVATSDHLGRVTRFVFDTENRQIFSINAMGEVVRTSYDAEGRAIAQRQYANRIAQSALDALPTNVGEAAIEALLSPAAEDRISRSVYDRDGRVIFGIDAENYVTRNEYDRANNVVKTSRYAAAYTAESVPTRAGIEAWAAAQSAALTAATSYTYDGANRVTDVTDAVGVRTHFDLDPLGRIERTTVAYLTSEAVTTKRNFDAIGRMTSETRAFGTAIAETMTYEYDALGRLTDMVDARGSRTERDYDGMGRMIEERIQLTDTQFAVSNWEYDARGNSVKTIDARRNASYYYYDATDRLTLQVDAEGYATKTLYSIGNAVERVVRYYDRVYDPAAGGSLSTESAPDPGAGKQAVTRFERDRLDRVTATVDAELGREEYTLDAFGDRIAVRNKLGGVTEYVYDRRGLVTDEKVTAKINGGSSAVTYTKNHYEYDARGNLRRHVEGYNLAEARTTEYEYDLLDRLTRKLLPAVAGQAGVPDEHYQYDARGNLTYVEDAAGGKVYSYYDAHNRKVGEVSPVGTVTHWNYDANGNVKSQTIFAVSFTVAPAIGGARPSVVASPLDRTTFFEYDRANRQIEKRVENVRTGRYDSTSASYGFSTGPLLIRTEYDALGNVLRETDANGGQVYHYYDRLGRELAKVDAENFLTRWTRDSEGNVREETRFTQKLSGTPTLGGAGPFGATTAGDRITEFEYDLNGRRTVERRLAVAYATVDVVTGALTDAIGASEIVYSYNELGEVTSKTEANGDRTDYQYDVYGRLFAQFDAAIDDHDSATATQVRKVTEYRYDALNNVVATSEHSSADGDYAFSGRVANYHYINGRLAHVIDATGFKREFEYDLAGRLIREFYQRADSNGVATAEREGTITVYDKAGRITEQYLATRLGPDWSQASLANQLEYNSFGEVVARKARGIGQTVEQAATQERFEYDNVGWLVRSSGGDGVWKLMQYDGNGNVTLTLTSNGRNLGTGTVDSQLDYFGAVMTSDKTDVVATIAVYDRRNMAIASLEPQRTIATADSLSIQLKTLVRGRTYNAFGEVATEIDARGSAILDPVERAKWETRYSYNTMGRLLSQQNAVVSVTGENGGKSDIRPTEEFRYDRSGRRIASIDANQNVTRHVLLAGFGHGGSEAKIVAEFRPDGSVWENRYDVYGDARIMIDGIDRETRYDYDAAGRVTKITRPSGFTEQYGYDGLGQRTRHWNGFYTYPVYDYDNPIFGDGEYGEPTITYPVLRYDPVIARTEYDIEGRVRYTSDFNGQTATITYSWQTGLGNDGLNLSGFWQKITAYSTGRSAIERNDSFGRLISRVDQGNHNYSYNYNAAGQLISETLDGGDVTTYGYFNTGQLAFMSRETVSYTTEGGNSNPENYLSGFLVRSRVTTTTSYLYDAENNRVREWLADFTQIAADYDFGGTYTEINSYDVVVQDGRGSYDALGRLTRYYDPGSAGYGGVDIRNEYDAVGNVRRTRTEYRAFDNGGGQSASPTVQDYWYRYDAMNRFTTVKGMLSGVAGAAGTTIIRGFGESRDIQYNEAGERVAAIRSTLTNPWDFGGGYNMFSAYGDAGFIGGSYYSAANDVNALQGSSYLGSNVTASTLLFDNDNIDGGGSGGGGGGFPYYDATWNGMRYLAANGTTQYVVIGDTSGTFGGRTPANIGQGPDPITGDNWYYDVIDLNTGNITALIYEPGSGSGGETNYPYYDGVVGGTYYQQIDGNGSFVTYLVMGDSSGAAGAYASVFIPGTYPSLDPLLGTWYVGAASIPTLVLGDFSGGETTYPYYDANAGGTFYLDALGTTSYLVYGDAGGVKGLYGGLAIPDTIPSIDPNNGGSWLYDATNGYIVLDLNLGGGGGAVQPYYDTALGGTVYQGANNSGAYLVVGDTGGANGIYGGKTVSYGDYDAAAQGAWDTGTYGILNGVTIFIPLDDPENSATTIFYNNGATYYQREGYGNSYRVHGDYSGSRGAYSGLTAPTVTSEDYYNQTYERTYYDAALNGIWNAGYENSAADLYLEASSPYPFNFVDSNTGQSLYWSSAANLRYAVEGDTSGSNFAYSWVTPPTSYPAVVLEIGTWYAPDATHPFARLVLGDMSGGQVTQPPGYPYYDANAPAGAGTFYWSYLDNRAYLVVGDVAGSAGTRANYDLPAIGADGVYDATAGGTWYAHYEEVWINNGTETISQFRYHYLVLDGAGTGYPYYNSALGGTVYQQAGSGTVYLVQGSQSASAGYGSIALPASYPALVAGVGTWYAADATHSTPRLVLGDLSGGIVYPYYSAAYGGTVYQSGSGALYLVAGSAEDTSGFGGLEPPSSFPSYSFYPAGSWYPADAAIPFPRLVIGDQSANPGSSYEVERYSYNEDGYLIEVRIGQSSYSYGNGGSYSIVAPSAYYLRARNVYDLVGRMVGQSQYAGFDEVNAVASRSIHYDAQGRVQSESNFVRKTDGKTYSSSSYNVYNFDGTLASTSTTSLVNNKDAVTSSTTNSYLWWDGAVQSQVTYRPDVTKSPNFTSNYGYNAYGHLTNVQVNDGRPRSIAFRNDMAGQVLTRTEADQKAGPDPIQHYYYYNGRQMGANGNNGNDTPDFATALAETLQAPPTGGNSNTVRAFRQGAIGASSDNGLTDGQGPNPFANFDAAYDPVSTGSFGGGGANWTVKPGESLEGIAQSLWGDASLWYMLAEANGIRSSAELRAGQLLQIPNKLANVHNTADTFLPYDPAKAIGDTQPTTPKPPKKPKCGIIGAIILVAIAIAVTAILKVPVTSLFSTVGTATTTTTVAGITVTTTATFTTLSTAGAIAAGATIGATAAVASGLAGLAMGRKFSWKSVALGAISGGVAAGVGELGGAVGSFLNRAGYISGAARGVVSSALTQGIGVATGLQDRFSWSGVAAGAVGGAVGGFIGNAVAGELGSKFLERVVSGAAGAVAEAAATSLIDGTSFGDNIVAVLPNAIANVLSGAVTDAIATPAMQRREARRQYEERLALREAEIRANLAADSDLDPRALAALSLEREDARPIVAVDPEAVLVASGAMTREQYLDRNGYGEFGRPNDPDEVRRQMTREAEQYRQQQLAAQQRAQEPASPDAPVDLDPNSRLEAVGEFGGRNLSPDGNDYLMLLDVAGEGSASLAGLAVSYGNNGYYLSYDAGVERGGLIAQGSYAETDLEARAAGLQTIIGVLDGWASDPVIGEGSRAAATILRERHAVLSNDILRENSTGFFARIEENMPLVYNSAKATWMGGVILFNGLTGRDTSIEYFLEFSRASERAAERRGVLGQGLRQTVSDIGTTSTYFARPWDWNSRGWREYTAAVGRHWDRGVGIVTAPFKASARFGDGLGTVIASTIVDSPRGTAGRGFADMVTGGGELALIFTPVSRLGNTSRAGTAANVVDDLGRVNNASLTAPLLLPAPNRGRLPQDIAANRLPPAAFSTTGRTVGSSAAQNAALQADIAAARAEGGSRFRVNQQQVNAAGQRVGINRPDLQYTRADGTRVYVEYDNRTPSTFPNTPRGQSHADRILANDPHGVVLLKSF